MHPFHNYLCEQLSDMLQKHSVVVFYDSRSEFRPFFDRELPEIGKGYDDLPRVFIGERLTFVARYAGSFFGVRAAVEPIAALEKPEPLIIYLPGIARDRRASVLMEMEKSGVCYEPQLKRLALNVLRRKFTDGQIDEMLRPATVTYDDIVSLLAQSDEGAQASVLRSLFDGAQSEALIALWLADETRDGAIQAKDATARAPEADRGPAGLELPKATILPDAREKTLRFVLVGEFRSDLNCDPPASVGMIPAPVGKESIERLREVANVLRKTHAEQYVVLANRVASDLNLEGAKLEPIHLGSIDTFRFEERRLLGYAGELIAAKRYDEALNIIVGRSRSFWVDREVGRQAQWEICRLMAELGQSYRSRPPGPYEGRS